MVATYNFGLVYMYIAFIKQLHIKKTPKSPPRMISSSKNFCKMRLRFIEMKYNGINLISR